MKNFIKVIGIIALVAVIGFAMIACDNGNGGNGGKGGPKTINIRAYNNKGVGPSTSRSVMGGRAVQPGFDDMGEFYGPRIPEGGITPTKFQVCLLIYAYTNTGRCVDLGRQVFDITKGITLSTRETFEVGETISAVTFYIIDSGVSFDGILPYEYCDVEFAWPIGNTNEEKKARFDHSSVNGVSAGDPNDPLGYFKPSITDGKASVLLTSLIPMIANEQGQTKGQLKNIVYGGNQRVLYTELDVIPVSAIIPGVTRTSNGLTNFGGYTGTGEKTSEVYGWDIDFPAQSIVVPFTPVTVPENATSITFEASWNLENIIHWNNRNMSEMDTFVEVYLKDGWWDELNFNVDFGLFQGEDSMKTWELETADIAKAKTNGAKMEIDFSMDNVAGKYLTLVWQSANIGDEGTWWEATDLWKAQGGFRNDVTYDATENKLLIPLSILTNYNNLKTVDDHLNLILVWWDGYISDLDISKMEIVTN
jgi:hypothetical protein